MQYDPLNPAAIKDHRPLALALCAVAIVGLVFVCFSHKWLTNSALLPGSGFGLTGSRLCGLGGRVTSGELGEVIDNCLVTSNKDFVDKVRVEYPSQASAVFPIAGYVTLGTLALSALALLGSLGLVFVKSTARLPVSPPSVAVLSLSTALISGCVFVATKPGGVGALGVGWAFWIFGITTLIGLGGAMASARALRPVDGSDDWIA